jgi:molybdopterin synthase catalytic subunit
MIIQVQAEPLDVPALVGSFGCSNAQVGALVWFVGLVRDVNEGDEVRGLTLEHYPGMTEKALAAILVQAERRWPILDALVVHRVGDLRPTDPIVVVAIASPHRAEAFAACEFVIDYLKTQAPFWKREQTQAGARWVSARDSDASAAGRWR